MAYRLTKSEVLKEIGEQALLIQRLEGKGKFNMLHLFDIDAAQKRIEYLQSLLEDKVTEELDDKSIEF